MLPVSPERALNFRAMQYEPSWVHEGGFKFNKHHFGPKPGELQETTVGGKQTEEFKCAQFLDGYAEVKFWMRNRRDMVVAQRRALPVRDAGRW